MPKSGPTVTAEDAAGTRGAERLLYVSYRKYSCRYTSQCLLILSTKDHKPVYAAELDYLKGK